MHPHNFKNLSFAFKTEKVKCIRSILNLFIRVSFTMLLQYLTFPSMNIT